MSSKKKDSQPLRDQVIAALKKKRAALARAQNIVVMLIEPTIDKEVLFSVLPEIAPNYYADVVDERNISKLCGYPLCDTTIEKIPTTKYAICGLRNKIYDVTERNKYCSGYCFKASEYIKAQVPTTPLWLRDKDAKIDFKLLPQTSK